MKFSKTKKIVALVLVLVILIASVFLIRSCSAPPKYEDIEARFRELMEQSHDLNVIIFGEGLPTYERLSDPRDSLDVYNTGEYYKNEDGKEIQRKIYYYYPIDDRKDGKIVAFRDSYLKDYSYVYVAKSEQTAEQLSALFPAIDGVAPDEGKEFYTELYRSKDGSEISYLVPYLEKTSEFYYLSTDPKDYDYVRNDSPYRTIDEIKRYAETIYSRSYTRSLYSSLFDGIASEGVVLKARFVEYTREDNTIWLTQNNSKDNCLFTERRVYLFDTAKVISFGSNSKLVRISIQSYLPSAPDKIQENEINLVLQDGEWYLDSPTF
jgi:hypothetical protein